MTEITERLKGAKYVGSYATNHGLYTNRDLTRLNPNFNGLCRAETEGNGKLHTRKRRHIAVVAVLSLAMWGYGRHVLEAKREEQQRSSEACWKM